jgi:hypothetical protein
MMYITRDYCKTDPWTAIIDMINANYFFQLYPGIVKLKEFEAMGPKRTRIVIEPNRSSNPGNLLPPIDRTEFFYDRLNCAEFFRQGVAYNVNGISLPITSWDIVQMVGAKNAIVFDVDDFLYEEFDSFTPFQDMIVQANPKSLRFVGFLKFRLFNTIQKDLATLGGTNEFPLINVEQGNGKLIGDYLLNQYDFTQWREMLEPIEVGASTRVKELAAMMRTVSGRPWNVAAINGPFNLNHAIGVDQFKCRIRYNGAITPEWSPRTEFRKVLVIELDGTLCTTAQGLLRLHYN